MASKRPIFSAQQGIKPSTLGNTGPGVAGWLLLNVLCLLGCAGLHAQNDTTGDPTGTSGSYNALVTTAGCYDAYNGNVKRVVTDVTVPGSNGGIPLAFTRIYNSRGTPVNTGPFFADSNWRHNYQWSGVITTNASGSTVYMIAYPDGSSVNFRLNRSTAPTGETFARGAVGTSDRLEITPSRDPGHIFLHLADGTQVVFGTSLGNPQYLLDLYGAKTTLTYSSVPAGGSYNQPVQYYTALTSVTEPGGRTLTLTYATVYGQLFQGGAVNMMWPVISTVGVRDASNNFILGATYQYSTYASGQGSQANSTQYTALTAVVYTEPSTNGGSVTARYTYTSSSSTQTGSANDSAGVEPPLLTTCDDPYFAGPMSRIAYSYVPVTTSGIWGILHAEQNLTTGESVSTLGQNTFGAPTVARDNRGDHADANNDGIYREFDYFQTSTTPTAAPGATSAPPATPTNAEPFQITTATDFQGKPSFIYYFGANDPNGWGYVCQTVDRNGVATTYQTEPFTGKAIKTTLLGGPNNSQEARSVVWGSSDGTSKTSAPPCASPYFLFQTTDERHLNTNYLRYTSAPFAGYVQEIDYPDGGKESFTYQSFNYNGATFCKLQTHTDQRGAQLVYAYDQHDVNHGGSGYAGLLTSVTRKYTNGAGAYQSESTVFYYDGLDQVNKVVDPQGVTNTFTHDNRHQLTGITHAADNQACSFAYDDYGNRYQAMDELGHTTTVAYDEYHRALSVSVPVNNPQASGSEVTSRYQAYDYNRRDNSDRLIGDALSHTSSVWSVAWKPTGSAVQRILSPNNWITDEYDGMYVNGSASPIDPTPGAGAMHTSTTYDNVGHVLTGTDAEGDVTRASYDYWNRLSTMTDPLGHVTTRTYYGVKVNSSPAPNTVPSLDCTGLLLSLQTPGPDAINFPTVTTSYTAYDALGRLQQTVSPPNNASGNAVTFSSGYNAGGDLVSQTDGAHATGYGYDQLGRKTSLTYPDSSVEKWTYDASGNLKTYVDRAGTATCTYSYDGRNRCTGYSWSDGTTLGVGYAYDAASHLTVVQNNSADIQFFYDDSGALKRETEEPGGQSSALATKYTHDADGNVDSITYPNGNYPCFDHDNQERCTGMYSSSTQFSSYAYSGDRLTERALYNGFSTTYDYQNNGRVWDVWHHNGNGDNVSRHCYGYAPDGQISWFDRDSDQGQSTASGSSLENGRGDAYDYYPDGSLYYGARDITTTNGWPGKYSATADSRLPDNQASYAGASASTYGFEYVYDAAGNRTQAAQMNQPTINYGDNGKGQNQYNGSSYDNNGNTTNSAVGWTYAYDAEGKMMSATGPGGESLSFAYDGLGRMIAQVNAGVFSFFYYAGSQRIEERDVNENLQYAYFFDAPGSDHLLFRQGGPWGRLWYQTDLLGNTTHLSAETYNQAGQLTGGAVVEQYLYDPYGTPSVYGPTGTLLSGGTQYDNRYLFKSSGGYEWLSQAGLYCCRARMYLPEHGRWLQTDPVRQAGGLNIYTYCGNDPVNIMDPSGLWFLSDLWHGIVQSFSEAVDAIAAPIANAIYGNPNQFGAPAPTAEADRVVVESKPVDIEEPQPRPTDIADIILENFTRAGNGPGAIGMNEYSDPRRLDEMKAAALQAANGGAQLAMAFPMGAEEAAAKGTEEILAEEATQAAEGTAATVIRNASTDVLPSARAFLNGDVPLSEVPTDVAAKAAAYYEEVAAPAAKTAADAAYQMARGQALRGLGPPPGSIISWRAGFGH